MKASLRALLSGVIDYAGLFPPAKLPLDEAIRNYARYRTKPESWMLGRFICPAARLTELEPLLSESPSSDAPVTLSVLGQGGGKSTADLLAGLNTDLRAMHKFTRHQGSRAAADVYEVRLPEDFFSPNVILGGSLKDAEFKTLDYIALIVENADLGNLTAYYELGLNHDWRSSVPAVVAAVANDNILGRTRNRRKYRPAGVKLRCGGVEASAFPTTEQVAFIITACRNAGVPLKLTAGLHHPVRHYAPDVATHMHGFLNLFVAGVLAHSRRLGEDDVRRIVEDEEPGSFVFDEENLTWRGVSASLGEITVARQEAVISFGSCSFDEPRDDLRALGLL